jgi:hypothetical protein
LDSRIKIALPLALNAEPAQRSTREYEAIHLIEMKAESLVALGKDEEAVAELQRALDAFPTAKVEQIERRIKEIVGAVSTRPQQVHERWAKAMKDGCADHMDIRFAGPFVLEDRIRRAGLAGFAQFAEEFSTTCVPRTTLDRNALAFLYLHMATTAADHEDCDEFRLFQTRYLEWGGSIVDLKAVQKNTSWCEAGDLLKSLRWMHASLEEHSLELNHQLVSILSEDGKVLALSGGKKESTEKLELILDRTSSDGFECRQARWHLHSQGVTMSGSCKATFTAFARAKGEHDEGSFQAEFPSGDPQVRARKLKEGSFRLLRQ